MVLYTEPGSTSSTMHNSDPQDPFHCFTSCTGQDAGRTHEAAVLSSSCLVDHEDLSTPGAEHRADPGDHIHQALEVR